LNFSEAGEGNAERLKSARWRESGTCTKCGARHTDSQLGLEPTPQDHVAALVEVFLDVRRVLRKVAAGEADAAAMGDLSTLADPAVVTTLISSHARLHGKKKAAAA
jgi:hypothetical protein